MVGGDFYDVYTLPAARATLGLVVADVTGKGLPAALMMAFSRAVMRSAAYNGRGPSDTLRRTNRVLVRDARTGLFLTALVACSTPPMDDFASLRPATSSPCFDAAVRIASGSLGAGRRCSGSSSICSVAIGR